MSSCLGTFLKKYGDTVLPYVEGLMPQIAPLLEKGRSAEERRIAVCVVDDLLDHSPAGRAKHAAQVSRGRGEKEWDRSGEGGGRSAEERRIAVCVVDDLPVMQTCACALHTQPLHTPPHPVEALSPGLFFFPLHIGPSQVTPVLLEACTASDADLRQFSAHPPCPHSPTRSPF